MSKSWATRRYSKKEKARIWRWALIGGAIFGALGFFGGIALCLSYGSPVPPLFTTELGLALGGSLAALMASLTSPSKPAPTNEGW